MRFPSEGEEGKDRAMGDFRTLLYLFCKNCKTREFMFLRKKKGMLAMKSLKQAINSHVFPRTPAFSQSLNTFTKPEKPG